MSKVVDKKNCTANEKLYRMPKVVYVKVVLQTKSCIECPKFCIKWKFGFLAGLGHHRTLSLKQNMRLFFGVVNNYALNWMIKTTTSFHNARFKKTFLSSAEPKFQVNCR